MWVYYILAIERYDHELLEKTDNLPENKLINLFWQVYCYISIENIEWQWTKYIEWIYIWNN